jgi:hypothetical protein
MHTQEAVPGPISKLATHLSPDAHVPPQVGYVPPPTQATKGIVVVVVLEVVVPVPFGAVVVVTLVVVLAAQPLATQASQQLAKSPAHAVSFARGVHPATLRFTAQRVRPRRVRQQVTAPGRPHVERAAHARTARRQAGESASPSPGPVNVRTHSRYAARLDAPAQSQPTAIAARAPANAAASSGPSPQSACEPATVTTRPSATRLPSRMGPPSPRRR